jgi:simple sugar transport system ATP-binding protein
MSSPAPDLAGAPELLRAQAVTKNYGPSIVLRGLDMQIARGEVVALVGDNGAGKSTFIKILSGFHAPTSGTLFWENREVTLASPTQARALGIETVYQDLALVNDLTVAQNMFLGREPIKRVLGILPLTDAKAMRTKTREFLDEVGIRLNSVDSLVRDLSGGQRQSIAVARAMQSAPKLLIMDEPLAALGVREGAHVLDLVGAIRRRRDVSVILIVHNYSQIFAVCDRINFLFSGEIVLDVSTSDITEEELIHMVKSGLGAKPAGPSAAPAK